MAALKYDVRKLITEIEERSKDVEAGLGREALPVLGHTINSANAWLLKGQIEAYDFILKRITELNLWRTQR